tara:strand:+ start:575 stop:769 length:195 start_codon:yes stop_codon:yes gene_type:complete
MANVNIDTQMMNNTMTYEQFQLLRQWAERVANTANDTDTNIRSIDLVHDIAGILANDEHFLPRL